MKKNNISGVYKILNKVSGNFYIGSTSVDIIQRWSAHKTALKRNKHHSPALQNAYNKYGIDSLQLITIEECPPDKCIEREQYYIDTLNPEYNCCRIAGSTIGVKPTEYQRLRAKEVHRGNKYNLGRKQTQEEVKRRQDSRRASGKNKPMLGKKHSEETKRLFSEQRKGKKNPGVAKHRQVPILCETNGKTYDSIRAARTAILDEYGIDIKESNISMNINGKIRQTKGFQFKRITPEDHH